MNTHDIYGVKPPEPTRRKDTPRSSKKETKVSPEEIAVAVRKQAFGAYVLHSLINKGSSFLMDMDKTSRGKWF